MTEKYKKPENLQTALDLAVKESEKKTGGYVIGDVTYCNYMTNEDWDKYLKKMDTAFKIQFEEGSGGELKAGKYPPKMASFGSSSRLIYELSKGIDGFRFEEKLDTRVGGIAHLDGSLKKDFEYTYIEAKKREIYGSSHKKEEIKTVYQHVYDTIKENNSSFSFEKEDSNKEGYSNITFKINNKPVLYFDLKQLICHFLGITYDIAKHSIKNAKVKFLYLLYNPHKEIEDFLSEKYRDDVLNRYDEVEKFIKSNIGVFESIFKAVLSYQVENNHLKETNIDFEIKLVDQTNYEEEFI